MSDTTGNNESITEIVPKVFGEYLKKEVSALRDYYMDFPAPNERIDMPSVSIFVSSPDFNPYGTPYVDSKGTIANSQAKVNYVVGNYDFNIQVDLWAKNKEQLDDVFDSLFNALTPITDDGVKTGISLTMEEYFDQICSFVYVGHERQNSEERSQRDEWRITMNVLASCKAIRSGKQFIMETFQTPAEIEEDGQIDYTVVVEDQ